MTDLDDEFERLLQSRKGKSHDKGALPAQPAKQRGVGVPDKVSGGSGTGKRAAVPAGPKAQPAAKDRPARDGDPDGSPATEGPKRASRGSTEKEWGNRTAFIPTDIPESRFPKRFAPGELIRGDSVWYSNERYYVEYFPTVWAKGTFARICSKQVRADLTIEEFEHLKVKIEALSFCVPVDSLEKAPTIDKPYAKQPTKTAVERREERKKTGATDIGDEVAVMLRECGTLDQVYECASLYVGISIVELQARYGHLNPGQQRMNLGNKMRFTMKHKTKGT